ncbi:MAG: hypothetical protein GX491_06785 [Chloroflexi bacterium]|nr:hypothetical protein [Chloroflexota bacterium]
MNSVPLTPNQIEIIEQPVASRIFLEGQAGSGKTTTGAARAVRLLREGVPACEMLILVPQRTLAAPYRDLLCSPDLGPGGEVTILTVGGLARRMVNLFWPLVAREAGFARPELPPSFLTLETALYYMAHLLRPKIEAEGLFDSVTIDRNRIYSQIIDNLNKAAMVGFPFTEIGERLKSAWLEDSAKANIYDDAQKCAGLFREYCLQNNLLDFSLQIEIFTQYLWPSVLCSEYLKSTYRHLIADNIEEDSPVAHDLLRDWLPDFDSALLIYDQDAGYRRFLGADPQGAYRLSEACEKHYVFTDSSFITTPELQSFAHRLGRALDRPDAARFEPLPLGADGLRAALNFPDRSLRFYPQMLDWAADQVAALIDSGTPPGEIVLLAPIMPDSLRFALANRLEARGIPYRSHRPSRPLRDEPAAQALLTFAALAHPQWGIRPANFEVAYALIQAIEEIDLVRAQLLVDSAYRRIAGRPALLPFEQISVKVRERITYKAGMKYEILRQWIEDAIENPVPELDFFFSRLFGEVLSQPGFGFHANYDAGNVSANLIESAQKFRWAVEDRMPAGENPEEDDNPPGKEYLRMIQDGVLAAQYVQSWQIAPDDAVLIAPAYTFLLANQPVDHQFWLDAGSPAWSERLYQPLTHPYILSRSWSRDRIWTDADEFENNRDSLYRLVLGLARRCRKRIHLGLSELSESGYESRGLLLRALQLVLRQSREVSQ